MDWMTLARDAAFAGVLAFAAIGMAETPEAATTAAPPADPAEFLSAVEKAHGKEAYAKHDLVRANIRVVFGGEERLLGTMTFDTVLGRSRIDLSSGTTLVFDGEKAWVAPADSDRENARFDLLTWPYFLIVPMKLADPGAMLSDGGRQPLFGVPEPAVKLTFEAGVGDAPDDWYILWKDDDTNLLKAMSYIVTYWSGEKEIDSKKPHAIAYDAYAEIDGVRLAQLWRFYNWDDEQGIHGDPIGEVQVSDIEFLKSDPTLFTKPENAREDKHPRAQERAIKGE